MTTPTLKIKRLTETAKLPRYMTPGSAGMDLAYNGPRFTLWSGAREAVGTRIAVAIPPGHVGLVCPRSGLAAKHGVTVANAPGVVDSDYTGEVKVILVNHGDRCLDISPDDRIAQLVIVPVATVGVEEVTELSTTERGAGGFGSTSR